MEKYICNPKNCQAGEGSMNFEERLERTMLAITFAEAGKHEWARKILTHLDEDIQHREEPAAKHLAIELYLQTLCEGSVKIEKKKFFNTQHYLIFVEDLKGQVRHSLIFGCQFLAKNTVLEIIEKLMSWHLGDVLRKAGKNAVLVSEEGLCVPTESMTRMRPFDWVWRQ